MEIKLRTNTENPILEFLDAEKYDDKSGFGATSHVRANSFAAEVFCTFEKSSMENFVDQLTSMNQTLSGEATLKPQWEKWFITFTIMRNGHIVISGMLCESTQELKFEFTTDQTILDWLIKDFTSWQNK